MNLKKKIRRRGRGQSSSHSKKKNDYYFFTFPCTKYRCIVKNINFKKNQKGKRTITFKDFIYFPTAKNNKICLKKT